MAVLNYATFAVRQVVLVAVLVASAAIDAHGQDGRPLEPQFDVGPVVLVHPVAGQVIRGDADVDVSWRVDPRAALPPTAEVTIDVRDPVRDEWSTVARSHLGAESITWHTPDATGPGWDVRLRVRSATRHYQAVSPGFSLDSTPPWVGGFAYRFITPTSPEVRLDYRAEDDGSAGLERVAVYGRSGGSPWKLVSVDRDARTPVVFALADGRHELYLTATDRVGNTTSIPEAETEPHVVVVVDTTAPLVRLESVGHETSAAAEPSTAVAALRGGQEAVVRYRVSDANLAERAISVDLSWDDGLTWHVLARHMQPKGVFRFRVPRQASSAARLRVRARDRRGNEGLAITARSFEIEAPASDLPPSQVTPKPEVVPEEKPEVLSPLSGRLLVFITSLARGVFRGGEEVEVRWRGDERELEPLSAAVRFSDDAGSTWLRVADGLSVSGEALITLPRANSSTCRLQLTARRLRDVAEQIPGEAIDVMVQESMAGTFVVDSLPPGSRLHVEPTVVVGGETGGAGSRVYEGAGAGWVPTDDERAVFERMVAETIGNHLERGDEYYAARDFQKARAEFVESLRSGEDPGGAHFRLGKTLWKLGEPSSAILRHFHLALEFRPDAAGIYNNIGLVRSRDGTVGAAVKAFRRAAAMAPRVAAFRWNLARELYREAKQSGEERRVQLLEAALVEFEAAVTLDKSLRDAYPYMAEICLRPEVSKLDTAEAYLKITTERFDGDTAEARWAERRLSELTSGSKPGGAGSGSKQGGAQK